jgi:aconitate hydratase
MITYLNEGHVYTGGNLSKAASLSESERATGRNGTIAYQILNAHNANKQSGGVFNLRFDSIASHDITYVSIIQTLRASKPDLKQFPLPYVLSNCHNTLCAVGGTINSDDHAFGLSAAKRYGGVFVPPHMAVIHQYVREEMAGGGRMILGSDSHTRYGAIGTMGFGEGGGELVKQLLSHTYDVPAPAVVGVHLTGEPLPWVGPQDVALALIAKVFPDGLVKNKVLEFFGGGVAKLSMDYRNGVDVMTTETACLSSIWVTDDKTEEFLALHGRAADYKRLTPQDGAYYDQIIELDLSSVKPMIALPFHPSNAFEIEGLEQVNLEGFPYKYTGGRLTFEQGVITGCAGGLYENIRDAAAILDGHTVGRGPFTLSVYPASQPVYMACVENGLASALMRSGAVMRTAFCGPCFGAGEVPPNGGLSARHATRNFPNREGSKPPHQHAGVALMDARSIAATALNHGVLTAASEENYKGPAKPFYIKQYAFDASAYEATVYEGYGKPVTDARLITGPGIRDWPQFAPLAGNLLLAVASVILDPVTTTDELIPSGETSSYRSNPQALAEFTLSRKDPGYVARAKRANEPDTEALERVKRLAEAKIADGGPTGKRPDIDIFESIGWGSLIYARRPGDGSAREQAASCQRVLGGVANIAEGYATKRYRSNLINWGMLPFIYKGEPPFKTGDYVLIPKIREAVINKKRIIGAYLISGDSCVPIGLELGGLTDDEREIILGGGLINFYKGLN